MEEDIRELKSLLQQSVDKFAQCPESYIVNAKYSERHGGYLLTIRYADQISATDVVNESNRSNWPIRCERLARAISSREKELAASK